MTKKNSEPVADIKDTSDQTELDTGLESVSAGVPAVAESAAPAAGSATPKH